MNSFPGFIDLQVNGFLTIDFSSPELTLEEIIRVANGLRKRGTIGFLATIITSAPETYERNLPLLVTAMKAEATQGVILGIHAEGPFLSSKPGAVGAHNPVWVKQPDIEFFKQMQAWAEGNIKILTIAAETESAVELTKYATDNGVAVSLGHQLATKDDLKRCADAGAKLITHLGNGMPNEVNRHTNPLIDGLAEDALTGMIITDGHHLPPSLIKIILRTKGTDKVIITSDASSLAGMPPGKYYAMGNDVVIEESGLLHNPSKQCLVGSSATMLQCVNHLASLDLVAPEDIIKMGFTNPLKMINIDQSALNAGNGYRFDEQSKQFVSC
ncbi:MAG: amidohydrolase family protein [Victivallaceae bacterium]|nr:amidohydrolase family protein [Victivallaceae bacterium]